MTSPGALARPAMAAMSRSPRAWVACLAWTAVAVTSAVVAHRDHWTHGADLILGNVYGALVLPLMAYAVVGAALEEGPVVGAANRLASLGAAPSRAVAATLVAAGIVCALVAAAMAALVAVLAHGSADPPVARDMTTSATVGALGGLAYGAWFGLGAAFGRRGGGRSFFLLLDWAVGSSGGTLALLSPRGHVRNLLGGEPPLTLSERASAGSLLAIAFACLVFVTLRARMGRLN
jgi:hypothetical protein